MIVDGLGCADCGGTCEEPKFFEEGLSGILEGLGDAFCGDDGQLQYGLCTNGVTPKGCTLMSSAGCLSYATDPNTNLSVAATDNVMGSSNIVATGTAPNIADLQKAINAELAVQAAVLSAPSQTVQQAQISQPTGTIPIVPIPSSSVSFWQNFVADWQSGNPGWLNIGITVGGLGLLAYALKGKE